MFQRTAHYVFPRFQERVPDSGRFSKYTIHVLEILSEGSILKLSKLSFEFGLLDCSGGGSIISTVNGDFLFCLDK